MSDTTTDHGSNSDPLAAIKPGFGAAPTAAEPEPGPADSQPPEPTPEQAAGRREFLRQTHEGLLDLAPDDTLDQSFPPDLHAIPASAEVVRQLRSDVRNLTYRVRETEKRAKLESIFVWAELSILFAIIFLHGRQLGRLAREVAQ